MTDHKPKVNGPSLSAISLGPPNAGLMAAELPGCPGRVLITSKYLNRWAVVKLSTEGLTDGAKFEKAIRDAEADLLEIAPFADSSVCGRRKEKTEIELLYLHLTDSCNQKCLHCYYMDRMAGGHELTKEMIDRLAADLIPLGLKQVVLSGGEPLLHSRFFEISSSLSKMGLAIVILTNGVLIDEACAAFLDEIDARVLVSLHGSDEKCHDDLCGTGSFKKALGGIKALGERLPPQKIGINCVLIDENLDKVEDIISLASGLGAGQIRFMPLHSLSMLGTDGPRLDYHSKALVAWAKKMARARVSGEWRINVSAGISGLPGAHECGRPGEVCAVGKKLVVAANGDVFPCALLMDEKHRIGNVNEGIDALAGSPRLHELSQSIKDRPFQIDECRQCGLAGICQGGCPALAIQNGGSISSHNPLCAASYEYAASYFKLVSSRNIRTENGACRKTI